MTAATELRKAIADFYEVDEARVGRAFPLDGPRGRTSIARATLGALIRRRTGRTTRLVFTARTYGELATELGADADADAGANGVPAAVLEPAAADPEPVALTAVAAQLRCGIDVERVANLPAAADYWESPFHRLYFTAAEIAYCAAQEVPADHFAARWSAKEALKKCDPALTAEDPRNLEVAVERTGAPFLVHHRGGTARRLPYALSLSHTDGLAIAIVVAAGLPGPMPADDPPATGHAVPDEPALPASVPAAGEVPRRRRGPIGRAIDGLLIRLGDRIDEARAGRHARRGTEALSRADGA